ncbi:hypothetical protein FRACYDRAFT_249418 [Fragilariopsis cylindrus CCMP1102]|uniref:Uncharacterized protein n=1 Tax=Fragilariopsis cylindrus CCMP1102 TaxID=635003 RepID=A0A1E7ERQ5_9STRA|nr:hypothetical protein FRACYDRAFT_249418 [Fragilariopsis cylindrus CCMP1102]|eukprot:OEU08526.1 hypothetical protein FRACYDRAFT_249418 [Fragilariopsis cylindrus CCMP1102]
MSSLHAQSDAVADRAMKEKLDSLLLEHRQALFSVLEMDRELQRNKETAANKAILLEAALTSAVVLLRAFLSSVFRKDREQRKEITANNEQQKNNEIIDLKKELEQCKETALLTDTSIASSADTDDKLEELIEAGDWTGVATHLQAASGKGASSSEKKTESTETRRLRRLKHLQEEQEALAQAEIWSAIAEQSKQQKNNEIIDLKKELKQCKKTAEQQNNEIIDLKKELVQQKEITKNKNK